MARESISMSEHDARAFLGRQPWVVLGTLDERGGPDADLVPSGLDGSTLYFSVEPGGTPERNIARDPRVCCANDQFPTYYEIKGVTAHGWARPVTDVAEAARARAVIGGATERPVYALSLDDVMSFDFSKIQNQV